MQKKNNVVVGKPSVALRHFLAKEDLDCRIESVDLGIIFYNSRLLTKGIPAWGEQSQHHNKQSFHCCPSISLLLSNPLPYRYSSYCDCGFHIPLAMSASISSALAVFRLSTNCDFVGRRLRLNSELRKTQVPTGRAACAPIRR